MESFTRFFITSRPHIDLKSYFSNVSRLDILASESDIEAYVTSKIDDSETLTGFIEEDPSLQQDIMNTVSIKARGMYVTALYLL
jgi:hypothetical protein